MPYTGLPEQVISIPLQAGVDLENAQELVDNSRFLVLQNIVFDKGSLGQLHKRPGYNPLGTSVLSGSVSSIGQATQ